MIVDSAGNIWLQDGGTTYGKLYNFSGMKLESCTVSDNDCHISVNDGGSFINALTIDGFSEAGNDLFNNDLTVGQDLAVTRNATITGNLTVNGTTTTVSTTNTTISDRSIRVKL